MWGILNGNICVAKAYLSEILTNDQQSLGFSGIGVADATGVYYYYLFIVIKLELLDQQWVDI